MPITTTPAREDVAVLIPDHTYDQRGNRLTDFRATGASPTQADANTAITQAETIVRGKVGRVPDDAEGEYWEAAANLVKSTIAHRAAMTLVLPLPSTEPEYDRLNAIYKDLLDAAKAAMQEAAAGEDPSDIDDRGPIGPYGAFPASMTSLDEAF